jgi:hypothetical protein
MVGLFGIRFGDYAFTEPEPVPVHGLPSILGAQAGLYVVLAFDPAAAPRPFRPLYFGESGDIRAGRRASTKTIRRGAGRQAWGCRSTAQSALCRVGRSISAGRPKALSFECISRPATSG